MILNHYIKTGLATLVALLCVGGAMPTQKAQLSMVVH